MNSRNRYLSENNEAANMDWFKRKMEIEDNDVNLKFSASNTNGKLGDSSFKRNWLYLSSSAMYSVVIFPSFVAKLYTTLVFQWNDNKFRVLSIWRLSVKCNSSFMCNCQGSRGAWKDDLISFWATLQAW